MTCPGFSIRSARVDDAGAIARLHQRAVRILARDHYTEAELESWAHGLGEDFYRERIGPAPHFETALDDSGTVIGFAATREDEIWLVYIDPDWARRGVGSMLLHRAEDYLRKAGLTGIWVQASLNAEPFYAAHGYRLEETIDAPTRGGLTLKALKMTKTLGPGDGAASAPEFTIRAARPEDATSIKRVHERAILALGRSHYTEEETRSWAAKLTPEGYRRAMKAGESFEVALDPSGRIVAFCSIKDNTVAALYTDPRQVRRGIGSALLASAEARLLAAGYETVELRGSLTAEPFYAKRGWRKVEYFGHKTRGGLILDAVWMAKTLAPAE